MKIYKKENNSDTLRDIFQLKFGKAKDAKAVLKDGSALMAKFGVSTPRVLTDLTGNSYTLVLESQWKSLGDWESTQKSSFGDKDWQNWHQKFVPLVESGSREIYTIVE